MSQEKQEREEGLNEKDTEERPREAKRECMITQNPEAENLERESLQVQKAIWVQNQIEKQRQAEDETWERLLEEQRILGERNRSIGEDMNRNRQVRRYHEDCLEDLNAQVYALHGVTEDKLQGMREYKNARYQGWTAAIFVCSLVMAGICCWRYGAASSLSLFMCACLGVEGCMLSGEGQRGRLMNGLCRFFYLLPLPAMAAAFICYKLFPVHMELVLTVGTFAVAALIAFGTLSYFLRNPYRQEKKQLREARADLREVRQIAQKTVKRNRKMKKKNMEKALKQERRKAARMKRKQERREKWLRIKVAGEDRKKAWKDRWDSRWKRDKGQETDIRVSEINENQEVQGIEQSEQEAAEAEGERKEAEEEIVQEYQEVDSLEEVLGTSGGRKSIIPIHQGKSVETEDREETAAESGNGKNRSYQGSRKKNRKKQSAL